jgi:3-oxoadipate enol-lactonase
MTPIVLLHAFPFDSSLFELQTSLPRNSATILAPNLSGFGDQPAKRPVTVFDMADHVASQLDAQKISKAVIGGVSMGGYVSLAFLNRYPEKVAGLILADTRADGDDDAAKANRAKMIEAVQKNGLAAFVESQIPKLLGTTTMNDRPAVVNRIREIATRQSPEGVIAAIELLRDRPDWSTSLAQINVPTLIIVGEEDTVTPPALSDAMHAGIEGSTLVKIPKAGHLSNMESPQEFNAAIMSFLSQLA